MVFGQLSKQFEDHGDVPLKDITLDPVDLSLANMVPSGWWRQPSILLIILSS